MSNFTKFDAISSLVGGNISGKTDGKNIIYEAFDRNDDILFLEYLNDL